ncbi:MAG: stage II sporulation protein D [Oscillospiraceae bacterium]|nr:stage II sporulation protein D [Oscillospiraceae bacterium]
MTKELLLCFLAGVVLPLALAAVFQELPPPAQPESSSVSTAPQAAADADSQVTLAVKKQDGTSETMPLQDYLVGVVLAEMPAGFEPEALKAQAVVARTYTQKRMEGSKHEEADVCTDPGCCQGFQSPGDYVSAGGTEASVEKVRQAVLETDALVLQYNGRLIDATYFSCSGGTTEDAVAVWGRDVPYLQSVESPGEEEAPRFTDTVRFSPAQFAEKLGLIPSGDPVGWFGAVTYTEGGGVDTMVILGKSFTGTYLRAKLGLRSTAFTVSVEDGAIVITTRGFGHRVGMSQYGAQAMALEGHSFEEILAHYYTGAELTREAYYGN